MGKCCFKEGEDSQIFKLAQEYEQKVRVTKRGQERVIKQHSDGQIRAAVPPLRGQNVCETTGADSRPPIQLNLISPINAYKVEPERYS